MPAPRKLPPVNEIERLYREGNTYEEIGAMFSVGKSAVYRALSRSNRIDPALDYRDIVPWKVDEAHRGTGIMNRIRDLVKKRQGLPLSPNRERLLQEWISGMEEQGVILNYHPEAPPNAAATAGGFYYSPRLPGEEGIFRAPSSEGH